MSTTCVLCNSSKVVLQETINVSRLEKEYDRQLGVKNALQIDKLEYFVCDSCSLGFFIPLEAGSEELYERLQEFDWYYMAEKYEFDIAKDLLTEKESVLEVGAGVANFSSVVGVKRYSGLEFNEKAIKRAKYLGVDLHKETVEEHAAKGYRYEMVVSFQVLEHVPDPQGFIKGCVQCVKPGGLLVLAVPIENGFVGMSVNNILNLPPHHVTRWTTRTLETLPSLFGLDLVSINYESVSEIHEQWARRTIWESRLRSALRIKFRMVDYRLHVRLVARLASLMSKLFRPSLEKVVGHTAVVVLKKGIQEI